MFRLLVLTLALAFGLIVLSSRLPLAAADPCGPSPCSVSFISLNDDIATYVPLVFRGSMLRRSALAEQAAPAQQCLSAALLGSISLEASGLAAADKVRQSGAQAIQADVSTLSNLIIKPTAPCLSKVRPPQLLPTPTPTPKP